MAIRSSNPKDPPLIQPNYLESKVDGKAVVAGLKIVREIVRRAPLASFTVEEPLPGPDCVSDDDLLAFAIEKGNSSYHSSGSCRMGKITDPMAVVDARGA